MPIILKICENLQLIAGERMRTARKNAKRLVWIVLKWLSFKACNLLDVFVRNVFDFLRFCVARAPASWSFSLSFEDISFFVCDSDCSAIRENKRNRASIWDSWRAFSLWFLWRLMEDNGKQHIQRPNYYSTREHNFRSAFDAVDPRRFHFVHSSPDQELSSSAPYQNF